MSKRAFNPMSDEIQHKKILNIYTHDIANDVAEQFDDYLVHIDTIRKKLSEYERDTLSSIVFDAAETVIVNALQIAQITTNTEPISFIRTVDGEYSCNNTGIKIEDSISIVPRKETKE